MTELGLGPKLPGIAEADLIHLRTRLISRDCRHAPAIRQGHASAEEWSDRSTMPTRREPPATGLVALDVEEGPALSRCQRERDRETGSWIGPSTWALALGLPCGIEQREAFVEGGVSLRHLGLHGGEVKCHEVDGVGLAGQPGVDPRRLSMGHGIECGDRTRARGTQVRVAPGRAAGPASRQSPWPGGRKRRPAG